MDYHAAPAVQLTRGRRVPTFDGAVVQMFFDDDRPSLTPFRTSECDLRVNDVSPRKPSRRLADKQNTRGVGRSGRDAERCGQWTTQQLVNDPVRQERILRHQRDAVELATRAMRKLDIPVELWNHGYAAAVSRGR